MENGDNWGLCMAFRGMLTYILSPPNSHGTTRERAKPAALNVDSTMHP